MAILVSCAPYEGSDSPCLPVMQDVSEGGANAIAAAGLEDDIPSFLVDDYSVGGLYCLADELAGQVEAVYLELWKGDDIAARWLTASPDATVDWELHLRGLDGADHTIAEVGPNQFIDVIGKEGEGDVIDRISQSVESTSIWEAVTKRNR